ncbi:MAG: alpha/beta hydrolase [Anaerolineales bacterium]|nr:alpha/beta hydrolase [Anaerolineales bacterium]
MMEPESKWIDIGFKMHLRLWPAAASDRAQTPFLLVHGLASNARTWDGVAAELASAGHPVAAIDQRGHGLSDKLPIEAGYDFITVTADLIKLLDSLDWEAPIVAGQSWGGNVVLSLGAFHPGRAAGLVFVDGGFLAAKQRAPIWEEAYEIFKPPTFAGVTRADMRRRMREYQPEWSDAGIEATLANFEDLPDGTVQPWLSLERHMTIFRALWEQDPTELYHRVQEPVLICPAGNHNMGAKRELVAAATEGLAHAEAHWFPETAHDIHVHRPVELAQLMLAWAGRHNLLEQGDKK